MSMLLTGKNWFVKVFQKSRWMLKKTICVLKVFCINDGLLKNQIGFDCLVGSEGLLVIIMFLNT